MRESKRHSMLAAARPSECWRGRRPGRKCPRKVNYPASQRELRIPLLRRHRSLTPENWLIRQAVPRTLRRDFSVPAFHTTDDSMERRTRPGGSALTARAARIKPDDSLNFFKSDSPAFWRRLEGTKALAITHRGENHVSGMLYCLQSLRPANAEVDPPRVSNTKRGPA